MPDHPLVKQSGRLSRPGLGKRHMYALASSSLTKQKRMKNLILCITTLLLAPLAAVHAADLKLASVFSDHTVLQRERPVPVWGWANPGDEVTVEFAGQKKTAQADAAGKWMVTLDSLAASSQPRDLVIESGSLKQKLTISDVLVGDVWLCSGQSNMWFPVKDVTNGATELASAADPQLRLFAVGGKFSLEPLADATGRNGGWQPCTPQSAEWFSASGFFFGRWLRRELGVPVGLIQSCWPGTPAEAWTSVGALRAVPTFSERVEKEIAHFRSQEEDNRKFISDRACWEEEHGVKPPPVLDAARGWADPALDTSDWKSVTLPATWVKLGVKSGGVFWVRKEVTLPASAAGKPFTLSLGWFGEQYDTAYFNGVEFGQTPDKAPRFYSCDRNYLVPGKLVREGRNVIAARVISATQDAQFGPPGHALRLSVADQASVDDHWLMKVEAVFPPLPDDAIKSRPKPNSIMVQRVPGSLYNGMIFPLMPFAIKGVIWYQGEDNAGRPQDYRELLSLMIGDWRAGWKQGNFPFLIQQLVNHGLPEEPGSPGGWVSMREAQALVAATVPASELSVGIDIGEALNVHPKNKQDIGKRLALVALEKVCGKPVESSGPRYESMIVEDHAIRLKFSHAAGLTAKDGLPRNFAIAGADRKFVWADARIEGDTVVVSSSKVPQPIAVRYAWVSNPPGCNMYNAAGLPMAPFRTDDWK